MKHVVLWGPSRCLNPVVATLAGLFPEVSWDALGEEQPLPKGRHTLLRLQQSLRTLSHAEWGFLRQAAAAGWRVGVLVDSTRSQSRQDLEDVLEELREGFDREGFDTADVLVGAPLLASISSHPGYPALARRFLLPVPEDLLEQSRVADLRRFI